MTRRYQLACPGPARGPRLSRRSLVGAALGLAGGALLAACGAPAAPTPTTAPAAQPTTAPAAKPAASKAAVSLRYLTTEEGDDTAAKLYDGVRAKFIADHPNVTFSVERLPSLAESFVKFQTEAAAGIAPDVYTTVTWQQQALILRDTVLRLDDMIKSENFDLKDQTEHNDLQRTMLDDQGRVYGFNYEIAMPFAFYVPEMLDAAGLKPPSENWTTSDLKEMANKLTKRDGDKVTQWGWANVYGAGWSLDSILMTNGSAKVADDRKTPQFTSPATTEVVQFYQDLMWKDKVIPTASDRTALQGATKSWMDGIWAGKVAMGFTQPVQLLTFRRYMKKDFVIAEMPTMKQKGTCLVGSGYTIAKSTKAPLEAFQHVAFLMSNPIRLEIVRVTGEIPTRRSAREEFFKNTGDLPPKNLNLVEKMLGYGKAESTQFVAGKSEAIYAITNQRMPQIWDEGKPIKPVLEQVQQEVTKEIASS